VVVNDVEDLHVVAVGEGPGLFQKSSSRVGRSLLTSACS
jgi:hypothetical protein